MLGGNNFGFSGSGGGGGGGGSVTSVGLSMPAAFSVSGSPVTAAGTLAVSGAGLASQYVRGDGTLGDFPNVGGGAGSQQFYFNGGVSQGTIGGQASYQMSKTANTGAAANFPITGNGLMAQFITDIGSPNQLLIPAGSWFFSAYFNSSNATGTPSIYAVVSKWDGTTLTTLATSTTEVITNGTAVDLYNFAAALPDTVLLATDRIVVTFYSTNTGGRTLTLYTQSTNLSSVTTTFPNGISSLNGLTANTQYFQTTTCGTDFGIVSSGNTHCFNLPTASCTNRGALSAADYCRFYNAPYCFDANCSIKATNTNCIFGSSIRSVISGGCNNSIITNGTGNFIGAGTDNYIAFINNFVSLVSNTNYAFIGGGINNRVRGNTPGDYVTGSFIGGGNGNDICTNGASAYYNAIVGGVGNFIQNHSCNFIGGGQSNGMSSGGGAYNSIVGGSSNYMGYGGGAYNARWSFIGGGSGNQNYAGYSFIGAGSSNVINYDSDYGAILSGSSNTINFGFSYSSILNGNNNTISNCYGVALGGQCNTVTGCYSGVANLCGVNASANCTFYFCNLCVLGSISGGGGTSNVFCNGASGCIAAGAAAGTTYYYDFTATGCLVLPTAVGNSSIYCLKNSSTTCIVACFTSGQNADGTNCILLIPNQALGFFSDTSNFNII